MDKWLEVGLEVRREDAEVVADVLRSAGARNGVAIDDPLEVNAILEQASREERGIDFEQDRGYVTVSAYYPLLGERQEILRRIEAQLALVRERSSDFAASEFLLREVSEADWANEWKKYFHVTHVGERLVIKPTWEEYEATSNELVLKIDPGMAFGTGNHHTTNMCLQWLEELVTSDLRIYDVGTGSGILAIAAALLGAQQITAVDIDPVAVKTAKENVALNGLAGSITVRQGDLLKGTTKEADLIIANILADVILLILPDVRRRLRLGGHFLASGIIVSRLEEIEQAGLQNGLHTVGVRQQGDWVALVMEAVDA